MNNINKSIINVEKSQNLVTKIEKELGKVNKNNKNNKSKSLQIDFRPVIKVEVYSQPKKTTVRKTSAKKATTKKSHC